MSYQHIRDTTRKARKQHRCFMCFYNIEPKSVYRERVSADRDGLLVMKCHTDCLDYADETFDWLDWETFSPGDGRFLEAVAEWKAAKEVIQ